MIASQVKRREFGGSISISSSSGSLILADWITTIDARDLIEAADAIYYLSITYVFMTFCTYTK